MIKLYNTLARQKEEFKPLNPKEVGLYTCGPTVYNFAHIGNLRTYVFEDILKRVLLYNGYEVKHVMNITDVGHLTDDADSGEDKLERGSKREGKSVWEIAEFYTETFRDNMKKLNITEPSIWCKATDYIPEQIDLIKKLEKKGLTYKIIDGVYFDTSKYPDYSKLGKLNLEGQEEGARVGKVEEKKNPTDFALWKFSPAGGEKRQMEWESPWGVGFPGWHIECSAMSMKHLGEEFDIHCGGIDHIPIHHTNERAQNWGATGKETVKIWMHGAFLNISGGKMAKSEDNFLTLKVLEDKGFNPLAYRYLALQAHYRSQLSFSWESLEAAQNGLDNLYEMVRELGMGGLAYNFEDESTQMKYEEKFLEAINDDLDMPKALTIIEELIKDQNCSNGEKRKTILKFDKILGLDLDKKVLYDPYTSTSSSSTLSSFKRKKEDYDLCEQSSSTTSSTALSSSTSSSTTTLLIDEDFQELADERQKARDSKNWAKSDELRLELEKFGFTIEDQKNNSNLKFNPEKMLLDHGFREDFSREIFVNKKNKTVVSIEYLKHAPLKSFNIKEIIGENNTGNIRWYTSEIKDKTKEEIEEEYFFN